MKFASFDIETAATFTDGTDLRSHLHEMGITCAAIALSGGQDTYVLSEHPRYGKERAIELVNKLQNCVSEGYTILSWNGFGFDFPVLAHESGLFKECSELALSHIDPMFIVFCMRGYTLGLQKAALGAGLEGKVKSVVLKDGSRLDKMSGSMAPELWAAGECDAVIEYLKGDVQQLLELTEIILDKKNIEWLTNKDKKAFLKIPELLTVSQCLELPLPDTSWMEKPISRESFSDWMKTNN